MKNQAVLSGGVNFVPVGCSFPVPVSVLPVVTSDEEEEAAPITSQIHSDNTQVLTEDQNVASTSRKRPIDHPELVKSVLKN